MSTLGTASASGRSRESRRGSTSTISSTRTRFPTYLPSHRATVSSGRFLPARSSSPFRARFDAEKDDGGGGAGGAAPVRGEGAGGEAESLTTEWKSGVAGKGGYVSVDLGGGREVKKK